MGAKRVSPRREIPDTPSWVDNTPGADIDTKNSTMTAGNGGVVISPTAQSKRLNPVEHKRQSVPNGTVEEVLDWAGHDPHKARAALAVENNKQEPRSTLTEELERRIAQAQSLGTAVPGTEPEGETD